MSLNTEDWAEFCPETGGVVISFFVEDKHRLFEGDRVIASFDDGTEYNIEFGILTVNED